MSSGDKDYPVLIAIFCADDAHLRQGEAKPRRVEVTTFAKFEPDGTWQEVAGRTVRERRQVEQTQADREREAEQTGNPFARMIPGSTNSTFQALRADDRSREHGRKRFGGYEVQDRGHHELPCKLCPGKKPGTRRTVRVRAEHLHSALDQLASRECREVSLAGLADILKQKRD